LHVIAAEMKANQAERVETIVDAAAALVFASAVAFVLLHIWGVPAFGVAVAGLSFFGAFYALGQVEPENQAYENAPFAVREVPVFASEELVLTEADRLYPADEPAEELLLTEALAHVGSDSRVVRLFEPAAIPTPGELKARIDRHVAARRRGRPHHDQAAPPDASQALFDALTELRRSLR
jgi:hypothetical protein